MKIFFMGTSEFAIEVLRILLESQFQKQIKGIVTQPDRTCGRGQRVMPPPLKKFVISRNEEIPIFQPEKVNQKEFVEFLKQESPDLIVVAAYGQILRREILEIPRWGCINVHASLLPRYRGADPIRWMLLKGEREAGISIMLMDEGMDTGPILSQKTLPIEAEDDYGSLTKKLGQIGGQELLKVIPEWVSGNLKPLPQNEKEASYAPKIKKELLRISWTRPALEILNQIRAFAPAPGAFCCFRNKKVKILKARFEENINKELREPGTIVEIKKEGIVVSALDKNLLIEKLHPESKKPLHSWEFCCGYRLKVGDHFE